MEACKNCEKRELNCHSKCIKYIAYRTHLMIQKKKKIEEKQKEKDFMGYVSGNRGKLISSAGQR